MQYFHRTNRNAANAIRKRGFRNSTGSYLTKNSYRGVWLSYLPLDVNDGVDGDALLAVEIDGRRIRPYEWIEAHKTYREFLVPASIINQFGKIRKLALDQEDDVVASYQMNRAKTGKER